MKNRFLFLLLPAIILFSSCKDDNNPLEPNETPSANQIWYDGKNYPADNLKLWGMGNVQKEYFHNDKDYNWYIDQANTGPASGNNCGPACATMTIKWYDKNFSKSVEDARNMYPMNNGWWYTNNIIDYLNHHGVPNSTVPFNGPAQLENIINDGNIFILCISTEYLRYNQTSTHRVDKFYSYSSGHFLVIKGFRKIDDETFFEVYDSNNWNEVYNDSSPKGKNRHYRSSDVTNAVKNWWNYVIVIDKNKTGKKSYFETVEPSFIVHKWGK